MRRAIRRYVLGLVAAATLLPAAIAGSIAVLFVAQPRWSGFLNRDGPRACLAGAALGIAIWLVLGLALRRFASADTANPGTYGELLENLDRLTPRLDAVAEGDAALAGVRAQAAGHRAFLERELGLGPGAVPAVGLRWLLATGYVDAWRRVHRIHEALIELDPSEPAVLGDALYDELRLLDSHIGHRAELLYGLRLAVGRFGSSAAAFLGDPTPPQPGPPEPPAASPTPGPGTEARAVLRQVRFTIDTFRDSRRAGIVRARNNLFATVIFTGVTSTLLLVVAILAGASPIAVTAAAAFYLVGGLVGLFRQLRAASAEDNSAQDDFGLSWARLVHTPLFSGLAAIGGVVLTAMVAAVIPLQPSGSGAKAGTPAPAVGNVPSLSDIFDVGNNPTGLIIAAVFGLAPNLLIVRLQRQVEAYKTDLKTTEAADKAPPAR